MAMSVVSAVIEEICLITLKYPCIGAVAPAVICQTNYRYRHNKYMRNCVFLDVTRCGACKNRRFGGA
jgi:type IV secretory pathway VirB3-like protein